MGLFLIDQVRDVNIHTNGRSHTGVDLLRLFLPQIHSRTQGLQYILGRELVYTNYFQTNFLPADRLIGIYDLRLVLLSYLVAVFASYIALDLTGRLRDRTNTKIADILWLIGGSIAMGSGIWSMHYIGMLSFSIPNVQLKYDFWWTFISLVVAISASGFALFLLKASIINVIHLVTGGIILGLAIASMHYTGMAAMLISLNIRYLPGLFLLSIIVAIVASEAAIWFALKSNMVVLRLRNRIKVISAIIMGLAICGMHYTGMAASVFTPLCQAVSSSTDALDPTILSMAIATITFVILSVAFFASNYKEGLNQQQFEKARELGIAEISSSVLHNVGNVLNSVNTSVAIITEKYARSPLIGLEKLNALLNEHKKDAAEFITKDARGIHTLDFINELAKCWREEKQWISTELANLTNNIQLIKNIISTQQNLNKAFGIEQICSVSELLNEALLITGLNSKNEIHVEKYYEKIAPIAIDKVKLIQILVNLLYNAKDALIESCKPDKTLIIKTKIISNEKISIEISENGIGILPANLNKIFIFGFTTKKAGHGFGLHTSALAINELGGAIHVKSDGIEQGATFILEIPYKKPQMRL